MYRNEKNKQAGHPDAFRSTSRNHEYVGPGRLSSPWLQRQETCRQYAIWMNQLYNEHDSPELNRREDQQSNQEIESSSVENSSAGERGQIPEGKFARHSRLNSFSSTTTLGSCYSSLSLGQTTVINPIQSLTRLQTAYGTRLLAESLTGVPGLVPSLSRSSTSSESCSIPVSTSSSLHNVLSSICSSGQTVRPKIHRQHPVSSINSRHLYNIRQQQQHHQTADKLFLVNSEQSCPVSSLPSSTNSSVSKKIADQPGTAQHLFMYNERMNNKPKTGSFPRDLNIADLSQHHHQQYRQNEIPIRYSKSFSSVREEYPNYSVNDRGRFRPMEQMEL
jgi:hypothetical protein